MQKFVPMVLPIVIAIVLLNMHLVNANVSEIIRRNSNFAECK